MTGKSEKKSDIKKNKSSKGPYLSPELIVFGDIKKLTSVSMKIAGTKEGGTMSATV